MDTIKAIRLTCAERNDFDNSAHFCLENFKTYQERSFGENIRD
jgi:hypothetical protein